MSSRTFFLGGQSGFPRPSAKLLAPILLAACGDDGGATSTGACRLVGAPLQLAHSRDFDVAALGDRVVLVVSTDTAVEARVLTADTDTQPEPLSLARGPVSLAVSAGDVLVQTFPLSWQMSAPRLARFDGASSTWSIETGTALEEAGFSTRGGVLAANDTELVSFWVEGVSDPMALVAPWGTNTFGPATAVLDDAADLSGYTVHAAFDGAGRLHVATVGDLGGTTGGTGLLHAVRDDGTWAATTRVGDTPGYFQNTVTTAMTVDSGGAVWLAEVHAEDFFEETKAGFTFWRDDGTGPKVVARPSESRLVVEGLDLAPLPDGRVIATASWGANNLEPAQSDDSVTLTLCTASACSRAGTLEGKNGVFYEATKVAYAGTFGVAAWGWADKGGSDDEGLTVQRFVCDPAP